MEMHQMMELLLKKLRINNEEILAKIDANSKAWREEMAAERRATETRAIQERTEAMREKMGTSHMEMVFSFKPEIEKETMAFREASGARLEEEKSASVDTKPPAAQQEEVLIVISVGEPEDEMTSITRKDTMACQEMEARIEDKEPTSVDRKPEVAQQREVPPLFSVGASRGGGLFFPALKSSLVK
jgi:hypothetical protein